MMSEEISFDGVDRTRSVLGDVTNQLGKRGFSWISTSGVKRGEGSQVAKKECLKTENLKKDNFHKEITASVLTHPCSEINSLRGNVISGISKIRCETKEPNLSDGRGKAITDTAGKFDDSVRDSCVSISSVPTSTSDRDCLDVRREIHKDERINPEVVHENSLHEKVETSVDMNDCNDLSVDNLDSSKDEFGEISRFPESQESRSSGSDRCIGRKGDGCSNSSTGIDLIKACSCSFCTKAAYIWSDLHYQDVKGRIAALKKSQKEASILVQRNCRDNGTGRHCQGNLNKFSKLESDLTGQWRSLFVHMEDIFARESSQLEASLFTLKDLRDSCKTDLEPIDGMPSEKQ